MVKIGKKEKSELLYRAILQLRDEQECYDFFQDLCTVSELRSMEQRFEVASLLDDGMIYNDILERTGASSATISRVNRSLSYGAGGYAKVFARMTFWSGSSERAGFRFAACWIWPAAPGPSPAFWRSGGTV